MLFDDFFYYPFNVASVDSAKNAAENFTSIGKIVCVVWDIDVLHVFTSDKI